MDNIVLTLIFGIAVVCLVFMTVAAYFYGFQRGAEWKREQPDPTPTKFAPEERFADPIEVVPVLEPSTGPIAITTMTTSIEIVPVIAEELEEERSLIDALYARIDDLVAQVARQSRLRARYLRLLRAERAMVRDIFRQQTFTLTPYWKREFARFNRAIEEAFREADQRALGIANIG